MHQARAQQQRLPKPVLRRCYLRVGAYRRTPFIFIHYSVQRRRNGMRRDETGRGFDRYKQMLEEVPEVTHGDREKSFLGYSLRRINEQFVSSLLVLGNPIISRRSYEHTTPYSVLRMSTYVLG